MSRSRAVPLRIVVFVAPLAIGCGHGKKTTPADMAHVAVADLAAADLAAADLASSPADLATADLSPSADLLSAALVAAPTLDFGNVPMETESTLALRITNDGAVTSGPLSLVFAAGEQDFFPAFYANDCENGVTTLAPGAYCDLHLTIRPIAEGTRMTTLTVSATPGGTLSILLTGNGTPNTVLQVAFTGPDLINALINRTSTTSGIRVTNIGSITSTALQPTLDDPIANLQLVPSSTSATPCTNGITLAHAQYCDYDLIFTPTSGYTLNSAIRVSAPPGVGGAAGFTAQGLWPIDIAKSGSGSGSISINNSVVCDQSCSSITVGRPDGVSIGFNATPASGSLFSGFAGDCSGTSRACGWGAIHGPLSETATFIPFDANVVFVSSGMYDATLGDVTVYDAHCNTEAAAAGLVANGSDAFIAWISSAGNGGSIAASSAVDRLKAKLAPSSTEPRGFVLPDGTPVADDLTSWLGGSNRIFNSIDMTASGNREFSLPWTGTGADGLALSGKTCADWTSTSPTLPAIGFVFAGPKRWTNSNASDCTGQRPLYCVMRTKTKTVTPVAPSGARKIWISAAGGTSGPDARCKASVPAGVDSTKVKALVAHDGSSAASLLESAKTYVRPDGTVVGTGARIAALDGTTPLLSGTWQLADGTYVTNANVVTGSGAIGDAGDAASTCSNWTTTSGNVAYGDGTVRNLSWWSFANVSCGDTNVQFYCIETP